MDQLLAVCVCGVWGGGGGEHDNWEWVEELSTLTGGPGSGCNIILIVYV